jgi:hypothetical protein
MVIRLINSRTFRVSERVKLRSTTLIGRVVNIDPEHSPFSIRVKWSDGRCEWHLKSGLVPAKA